MNKNEFELLECLLGCRKQLRAWGDYLDDDYHRDCAPQLKEVDKCLDQLNVLIKMTKKGMKVLDT